MSVYKRPLPRHRVHHAPGSYPKANPPEGSVLHSILTPSDTKYFNYVRGPVYKQDDYLKGLKKNNKEMGIPYKDPQLPEYTHVPTVERVKEPELTFVDRVYMKMRILKNGTVRIKLDPSFAILYEKYYSKGKTPPQKNVIQAYKSMGFSNEFLEKIKKGFAKNIEQQKRIEKVIDKVFNKEPMKKTKRKKKEEEPVEVIEELVEDVEEEEDDEEDPPPEDEGMDVEPVEEEDVEEPVEEEYFSD